MVPLRDARVSRRSSSFSASAIIRFCQWSLVRLYGHTSRSEENEKTTGLAKVQVPPRE